MGKLVSDITERSKVMISYMSLWMRHQLDVLDRWVTVIPPDVLGVLIGQRVNEKMLARVYFNRDPWNLSSTS